MISKKVPNAWMFLCCCAFISTLAFAQPKTIRKSGDEPILEPQRKRDRTNAHIEVLEVKQAVTIDVSRLISLRFPSVAFSYQRFLGDIFSVQGTLGLPINQLTVYRELSPSRFPGFEAGLGGRVYFSEYTRSRFYFALDANLIDNTVKANAFVREPGKVTYREQELNLNRRRQLLALSLGYQLIAYSGFSLDLKAGLSGGRRGVFAKNKVDYISDTSFNGFRDTRPPENEWRNYRDIRLIVGFGYAF